MSAPVARCRAALQSPPVLTVRGASKRFGAVTALEDIDLDVRSGEVLALLGDNGAGKSTLIKCLNGVHRLDSGSDRDGRRAGRDPHARRRARAGHRDGLPGPRALRQPAADRQLLRRSRARRPAWLPRSLRVLKRRQMTDETREVLERLQVSRCPTSMPSSG